MKKVKGAAHDDLDLKYKLVLISSPLDYVHFTHKAVKNVNSFF